MASSSGWKRRFSSRRGLAGFEVVGQLGGDLAYAVGGEGYVLVLVHDVVEEQTEAVDDGAKAHALDDLSLGTAEVRAENDLCFAAERVLDGGNGLADASVVSDDAVLERDIEVDADEEALVFEVQVADGEFHVCYEDNRGGAPRVAACEERAFILRLVQARTFVRRADLMPRCTIDGVTRRSSLPREMAPRRFDALFRTLIVIVCAVCGVWMVALTWHWPLVWDAQVMHYANFLIRHGFAPYRDITDMNLPGSYVMEGAAMRIFGGGDLAWRFYDFSLLGMMTASMIVIALPYDWIAGLLAGVMFALIHASEGPQNGGQRDEAMTALLVLGYALLFLSIRHRKIWGMLGFGMALGLASSIKPTIAPLAAVLLGMAGWKLRNDGERAATYVWMGLLGLILGGAPAVLFLCTTIRWAHFWR